MEWSLIVGSAIIVLTGVKMIEQFDFTKLDKLAEKLKLIREDDVSLWLRRVGNISENDGEVY